MAHHLTGYPPAPSAVEPPMLIVDRDLTPAPPGTPLRHVCANWLRGYKRCNKYGVAACTGCRLVVYCGRDCQQMHWDVHREVCRTNVRCGRWEPAWVREDRRPAFVVEGISRPNSRPPVRDKKMFWGDVPANDILDLNDNEGEGHNQPLKIAFAAAKDLRDTIKTVVELPKWFSNTLDVSINEPDEDLIKRCLVILLLALAVPDSVDPAEAMIHFWYSTCMRQEDHNLLIQYVQPLLLTALNTVLSSAKADHADGNGVEYCFRFGPASSVSIRLPLPVWVSLSQYLNRAEGIWSAKAQQFRASVVQASQTWDFLERKILLQMPSMRASTFKYINDGIVVPYGHSLLAFDVPNMTLIDHERGWRCHYAADPLSGWHLRDFIEKDMGGAASDSYGKLFYHLKDTFTEFRRRVLNGSMHFHLYSVDPTYLASCLERESFDRIDLFNQADGKHIGVPCSLASFIPLLKPPSVNPKATLIAVFPDTVLDEIDPLDEDETFERAYKFMRPYLSKLPISWQNTLYSAEAQYLIASMSLVRDVDKLFNRFMRRTKFREIASTFGAVCQNPNNIIPMWPLRMPSCEGDGKDLHFIQLRLSACHRGYERYIEWRRADSTPLASPEAMWETAIMLEKEGSAQVRQDGGSWDHGAPSDAADASWADATYGPEAYATCHYKLDLLDVNMEPSSSSSSLSSPEEEEEEADDVVDDDSDDSDYAESDPESSDTGCGDDEKEVEMELADAEADVAMEEEDSTYGSMAMCS